MEAAWKRIQVPKGFTIWMMVPLGVISLILLIAGFVLTIGARWVEEKIEDYVRDPEYGNIVVGILALIIGLLCLPILIVWIIFMMKKIYAPIGSKKNYGERKPINTKFMTFTYSTWFYVFGMVVHIILAIVFIITTVALIVFSFKWGIAVLIFAAIAFVPAATLIGLWVWFIAYQTKPLYKGKTKSLNKK